MANKTLTLTLDMTYTSAGGSSISTPRKTISVPYQAVTEGLLDVPAGATSGVTYAIPFGAVGTEATAIRIDNNSDGPLGLRPNGLTATTYQVAAGGSKVFGGPTFGVTTPLTAMTVVVGTTQAAAGTISYWVFGDPT
jgi:hypothetical protein